ncbi:MAG: ATPase [marine bacterium B5-7]|nr:MAG: ATPase [marine bacterium B5-7]
MNNALRDIYQRVLGDVPQDYHRFLFDIIDLNPRLIGLVGPRGVGKTTLLLQLIKEKCDLNRTFYFSADHILFSRQTLYEFVDDLYMHHGITHFFIDEIHQYKNWNQELKNLYDGFPDIHIVFSGSSSIDIVKGSYDLSRRALLHHLPGLSFREYIHLKTGSEIPKINFSDLLSHEANAKLSLVSTPGIKGLFTDYLNRGYYPFSIEDQAYFKEKLANVIHKMVFEDIANFYQLKTENLIVFKKILNFLASIPPGKTSTYSLAKNLSMNDRTIHQYLVILEEIGLIHLLTADGTANQQLRKPEKVLLSNTNLLHLLSTERDTANFRGMQREIFFLGAIKPAGLEAYYDKFGDYRVNDITFEIGGKNKTRTQIQDLEHAFIVKDDAVVSYPGSIPLMFFGFLY